MWGPQPTTSPRLKWGSTDYGGNTMARKYRNQETLKNEPKPIHPQRKQVERIKVLQESKNFQDSIFKPSIKIYYKDGQLNTPRENNPRIDSFRYFEPQTRKRLDAPQTQDTKFINEQRFLLPHQRVRTPNTRVHTESTERVFDGVRSRCPTGNLTPRIIRDIFPTPKRGQK